MSKTKSFAFLVALFFFILVSKAQAAPGDLDTTFGNGGKVITPITPLNDYPSRVRIQPDGKIITIGTVSDNDFGCLTNSFLVRYNADGALDNSFGTNGSVVIGFGSEDIAFQDFVILPDGKLLVSGYKSSTRCGNGTDLVIYRYTAQGTRDATFGSDGVITTPVVDEFESRIVLQPDGKFVVASGINSSLTIVRYNPDGSWDSTFGTGGISQTFFGHYFIVREALEQPDGKLLIAGDDSYVGNSDLFVLRYNQNGALDNSFGANGIVQTDIDSQANLAGGMALQPDGKILINSANYSSDFPYRISFLSSSIVRYNANGALDNTFGAYGIVRIAEQPSSYYTSGIARALALQQNGKILTAGKRDGAFAVSLYNPTGTIDTSFGTNGTVITPFGTDLGSESIFSIALQTDGKVVAVGRTNDANSFGALGLVRYLGGTATPGRARADFDGDGKTDLSLYRPSEGNWYALNSGNNSVQIANWGAASDKLVPGDYDNDGKADVAVYRPSTGQWFILRSSDSTVNIVGWGNPGDLPEAADYDGDGKTDVAVYRPSEGTWYTLRSSDGGVSINNWGNSTDLPVQADYDGDGKADVAVFRPSTGQWFILRSRDGVLIAGWGIAGDKPVEADYDGDNKDDIAVFRPSDGNWYILRSSDGSVSIVNWGSSTDVPVPGDYDGDGKDDQAVYRNGTWLVLRSTAGPLIANWGVAGDTPIPSRYIP